MVIALGVGARPTSAAADAASGTVLGSVTSTGTQNALQGAVVAVPALNRTGLTDNAGGFVVANLPAGPVEVVIAYTGFNDERRTVLVRAGESTRIQVMLAPTPAMPSDMRNGTFP